MTKYKFFIPYFLGTVEVFPLGVDKLKFKYSKIEDTKAIRKKLTNEITFRNDPKNGNMDFDFLYEIETNPSLRCNFLEFHIHRSCDNGKTYTLYYTGKFTLNGGKFDLDSCLFKTNIDPLDKYSCLLENQNKEINLVQSGPLLTLEMNENQVTVEYTFCAVGAPGCSTSLTGWAHIYTYTISGIDIFHFFARELYTTVKIAGTAYPPSADPNWYLLSMTGTTATYARPYIGGTVSTNIVSTVDPGPTCSSIPAAPATIPGYGEYTYVHQFYGVTTCISFFFAIPINGLETYTQFRTLYNALNYIVNQICPSVSGIVSDFFEWNPIGDAPGYIAGKNYVTGDDNIVAKLAIAQKSDIIDPTASQPATKGFISFKKLMLQLKTMFNVYSYIDSNNKLRIEHDSFFVYIVGYNSTVAPHDKFNVRNRKYDYNKADMPSRESFKFMESDGLDFVGTDIVYSGSCVNTDVDNSGKKEYSADVVTTDLNYIQSSPGDIAKLGFVIAAYYNDGTDNVVHQEAGLLSGNVLNNAHLSWANLQYNFHRHGRVLIQGEMNAAVETFLSVSRQKKQQNVKLQICCGESFNPEGVLITTSLGDGEVIEADEEYNLITMSILI